MKRVLVAALVLFGFLGQAAADVVGFTGAFAPSQWTRAAGDGSILFNQNRIRLNGGDDGAESFTDAYIVLDRDWTISFDWNYRTFDADGPFFDPFGMLTSDTDLASALFTQLTDDDGPARQNGSYTYFAEEGTLFGFRQWSLDGTNGNAFGRITNFSAQAVPEPGTLGLLAAALIAAGLATSRRRRQA